MISNSYYKLRTIFLIAACLLLGACNSQLTRNNDSLTMDADEMAKLANIAYEENDWGNSEKYYAELVHRIPENPLYWFRLGNVYTSTQRPDAAVTAYREALVRDPKMSKAWYNMGVLQLKQAANSFNQLNMYVDKNDPLYPNSNELLEGIINLIQGNTGGGQQGE